MPSIFEKESCRLVKCNENAVLNGLLRANGKTYFKFSMGDGVVSRNETCILYMRKVGAFAPSRVAPRVIYPVPAICLGQVFYLPPKEILCKTKFPTKFILKKVA